MRRRNSHSPQRRQTVEQQIILQEEIARRYTKFGSQYEVNERQNARVYIDKLREVLPQLSEMYSIQDVDEALQKFATRFCAGRNYIIFVCLTLCSETCLNRTSLGPTFVFEIERCSVMQVKLTKILYFWSLYSLYRIYTVIIFSYYKY